MQTNILIWSERTCFCYNNIQIIDNANIKISFILIFCNKICTQLFDLNDSIYIGSSYKLINKVEY